MRFIKYKLLAYYNNLYNAILFFRENIIIGKDYRIKGRLFVNNKGTIKIGENFKANSGKNYNPIGGDTVLRLLCHENAKLIIGNNVGMSNSTFVCANKITIKNNVMIGGGCRFWDTDFHPIDYKIRGAKEDAKNAKTAPILIKKNAFVGGGSVILKGVTIGEKSVVAAGSVVSKSIPDGEIWGGNPAKFIKKL